MAHGHTVIPVDSLKACQNFRLTGAQLIFGPSDKTELSLEGPVASVSKCAEETSRRVGEPVGVDRELRICLGLEPLHSPCMEEPLDSRFFLVFGGSIQGRYLVACVINICHMLSKRLTRHCFGLFLGVRFCRSTVPGMGIHGTVRTSGLPSRKRRDVLAPRFVCTTITTFKFRARFRQSSAASRRSCLHICKLNL